VKDENDELLADSHILNRWKNYFSQLLNMHSVRDVRQIEIHMTEPLVPDTSCDVEIAIAKLKSIITRSDKILAELIQAGSEPSLSAIHKPINSIWNKEELPDLWKETIIVTIYKKAIKLTVVIIVGPCSHSMACPRVADGGTASSYGG
jgi:hypothetical protein